MFQYFKYLTLALKIAPCLIKGFEDYEKAKKEDSDITPKEWAKVIEDGIKCILSKFDVPGEDKATIENLFNDKKYEIKLS